MDANNFLRFRTQSWEVNLKEYTKRLKTYFALNSVAMYNKKKLNKKQNVFLTHADSIICYI